MDELISVIVPVYKVELYLNQCIQSIVDQTYRNLEIILVDDGSPDRCGAICDAWAAKDARVRAIHTPNQGSGAARNTALDSANGEFIAFVDSDDYIAPGMLANLHSLMAAQVDIAECGYISVSADTAAFTENGKSEIVSCGEAMKAHICNQKFCQVIWNKLYRKEVIGDVRFPVGMKIDDEFFTYRVLGRAEWLARTESVYYAYRQQEASIMHTVPVKTWFQSIDAKIQRHEYVLSQFPELGAYSLKSIVGSLLYLCQLAQRKADKQTQKDVLRRAAEITRKYPINDSVREIATGKEWFWLTMSVRNMALTCSVRNLLRIGL